MRLLVHCWKSVTWTSLYPTLPFITVAKRYQAMLNQPDASHKQWEKNFSFSCVINKKRLCVPCRDRYKEAPLALFHGCDCTKSWLKEEVGCHGKRLLPLADAIPARSGSAERGAEPGASSGLPQLCWQSRSHCEQTRCLPWQQQQGTKQLKHRESAGPLNTCTLPAQLFFGWLFLLAILMVSDKSVHCR